MRTQQNFSDNFSYRPFESNFTLIIIVIHGNNVFIVSQSIKVFNTKISSFNVAQH